MSKGQVFGRWSLGRTLNLLGLAGMLILANCSDEEGAKEPVAIDPNAPAAPADAAAAAPTPEAEAGAPNPIPDAAPPPVEENLSGAPKTDSEAPVGELGKETGKKAAEAPTPAAPDKDYGGSFDNGPGYDTSAPVHAGPSANVPESGSGSVIGTGKSKRYVQAVQLNVRSEPNRWSKVVRRVNHGDVLMVTLLKGGWSKLAEGEFVRTKHLGKKVAAAAAGKRKAKGHTKHKAKKAKKRKAKSAAHGE